MKAEAGIFSYWARLGAASWLLAASLWAAPSGESGSLASRSLVIKPESAEPSAGVGPARPKVDSPLENPIAPDNLGLKYKPLEPPQDPADLAEKYRKRAEAGEALAQLELGRFYAHGYGVPQDDRLAVFWYRKAAEQEDATAQYILGVRYYRGLGVEKDLMQAAVWIHKAADQGSSYGEYLLGCLYEEGKGVKGDPAEAAKWYLIAAKSGNASAAASLGCLYQRGKGVELDPAKAFLWYQRASDAGDVYGRLLLGEAYLEGIGTAVDERHGFELVKDSAERGEPEAEYGLGLLYGKGQGVAQDESQAAYWYRKAAEQGSALAACNLGLMYAKGKGGLPQDAAQAVEWYRKGAEAGSVSAAYNLGMAYINGKGTKQDLMAGCEWLTKAADRGLPQAQLALSYLNSHGLSSGRPAADSNERYSLNTSFKSLSVGFDVLPDGTFSVWTSSRQGEDKDLDFFRKAAGQGNLVAQAKLGRAYAEGRGLPRDEAMALYWLGQAAEQGSYQSFCRYIAIAKERQGRAYLMKLMVSPDPAVTSLVKDHPSLVRALTVWLNEDTDFADLKKSAAQGEVRALAELGRRYLRGDGLLPDFAKAFEYLSKAAARGDAEAQANLGFAYLDGLGVREDTSQALVLAHKTADQGNRVGRYLLGIIYSKGKGVQQDYALAAELFRQAAAQGDADAQCMLGHFYERGLGVSPNRERAIECYRLANKLGCKSAKRCLEAAEAKPVLDIDPASEHFNLVSKSAMRGNALDQYKLAILYEKGSGVAHDHAKALEWLRKSAAQNYPEAQILLGQMQEGGAADANDAAAQFVQGEKFERGDGCPQDYARAAVYYRRAAEGGYVLAQFSLGVLYELGQGVEKDLKEAESWYRRAACQGDPTALNSLISLLMSTHSVEEISELVTRLRDEAKSDAERKSLFDPAARATNSTQYVAAHLPSL